jgi:TruD family tRNA pseudouridine synthase
MDKIARKLRVSVSDIMFAGTKDKRAYTYQKCSIFISSDHLKLLENIEKFFSLSLINDPSVQIFIGNISFSNEPIALGQLCGNKFTIRVKSVTLDSSENQATCIDSVDIDRTLENFITERKKEILQFGFPNYFVIFSNQFSLFFRIILY